jgi:hypothetical protein
VTLGFLEHHPYARAHYEGVRRANLGTINLAMQHASYNSEKTFLFLHPEIEFRGQPDGCSVPHPDYVFAMGGLGRKLFLECGYPEHRVWLTGSARYDQIKRVREMEAPPRPSSRTKAPGSARLLLISSLDIDTEMDMVDAACKAVKDLNGIKLLLRNHPFSKIETHPMFRAYKNQIEITRGTLEEDLESADVLLYTYSTVGEEAFIRRKPVWQWVPMGFNGSALSEEINIPRFTMVSALRQQLIDLPYNQQLIPSDSLIDQAIRSIFYSDDNLGTQRIAEFIKSLLMKDQAN